jgi:O-antigen/teichoic acid export membrane protein
MVTVPLQWLCLAGIVRTLGLAFGPVLHAKGRPDVTVKLSLARVPLVAGAVWLGSRWGITGAAAGFAIISVLWFFVNAHIVTRLLHYPIGVFFAGLLAPCGATVVMATGVYWLLHVPVVAHLNLGWQILAAAVAGASLYGGAMMLFGRQQLVDIADLLAQFKK